MIGRKNIRSCKGKRVVIAPNHTFELDFAMTRKGTGLLFRYLAHCDEFKGIRGFLGAWTGGFGVNLKTENGGENARIACVKALKQNESSKLLIFPQGKLIRDNILRAEEFKTGAVRIARQVAEETGEPVVILPVALYYKQNPCESSRLNRLFHKLGLRFTRSMFSYTNYGGCVVIGKPIATQSLPEDPHAATEVLRKEIDALLTVAKSN